MHPRNLYLAGLLVVVVGACDGSASVDPPDENQMAGKVIDVSGEVIVQSAPGRREQAAALAVGDEVAGGDTIVTGADGRVAIQLYHNNRVWNLGEGKQTRLADTWAWTASRVENTAGGRGSDDERTAAAGRQAERRAGSTRTTAMPTESAAPAIEAHQAPRAEEEPAANEPPAEPADTASKPRADTGRASATAPPAPPSAGAADDRASRDEVQLEIKASGRAGNTVDDASRRGATRRKASGNASRSFTRDDDGDTRGGGDDDNAGDSDDYADAQSDSGLALAPDSLTGSAAKRPIELGGPATLKPGKASVDRRKLTTALGSRLDALARCVGGGPNRRVSLALTLRIAADGSVSKVRVRGGAGKLARCARKAYTGLDLGDHGLSGPLTVTQPLIWTGRAKR